MLWGATECDLVRPARDQVARYVRQVISLEAVALLCVRVYRPSILILLHCFFRASCLLQTRGRPSAILSHTFISLS